MNDYLGTGKINLKNNVLYEAIRKNENEKVKKLLSRKTTFNLKDNNFLSVILMMQNDNLPIFSFIFKETKKLNIEDFKGGLLNYSIQNNSKQIFIWILQNLEVKTKELKITLLKALINQDSFYIANLIKYYKEDILNLTNDDNIEVSIRQNCFKSLSLLLEIIPIINNKTYECLIQSINNYNRDEVMQCLHIIKNKQFNIDLKNQLKDNNIKNIITI